MKDILRLGSTLFAICAIAALALGVTDNITKPIIEDERKKFRLEHNYKIISIFNAKKEEILLKYIVEVV